MKYLVTILLFISGIIQTQALVISEIMSNPTGDDSGREWIEIYNNSNDTVDISALSISIKGGTPITVAPVSGGMTLSPNSYAIIGSTVSGATKFLLDYPNYNGVLYKSAMSLVNTGVTSLLIKLNGVTADNLASYTAAKEGATLSLISGSFIVGNPTPGSDNQVVSTSGSDIPSTHSPTSTENQVTIAQMSPPSADIVLYVKPEKTVIAGAESTFSVFGMTRKGDAINNLVYTWAFGDGGQGAGSSTMYRYLYPGVYVAQVEATNGYVIGTGMIRVRVVSPDIIISKFGIGKYGAYIDVTNPNTYDLDLSQWKFSIDGALFTIILGGATTHFSGAAMGFASSTVSSSTVIRILFPNYEEVTRFSPEMVQPSSATKSRELLPFNTIWSANSKVVSQIKTSSVPAKSVSTSTYILKKDTPKDTRIATFFKSVFRK